MIFHVEQGSPEWAALRYGRLTSTRAANVLGLGWSSPRMTWEVMTGRRQEDSANENMRHGSESEDSGVMELELRNGKHYEKMGFAVSDNHPFLAASPDRVLGDRLLEVKCPARAGLPESAKDVRPGYVAQVLQAAVCTGFTSGQAELFYYIPPGTVHTKGFPPDGKSHGALFLVDLDSTALHRLVEALGEWYWAHCVRGVAPPPRSERSALGVDFSALVKEVDRW